MRRVFCLADRDLDGTCGAALVRVAHQPEAHVTTVFTRHDTVNQLLYQALTRRANPYDRIVVVDISWGVVGMETKDPEINHIVNNRLFHAIKAYVAAGGELVLLDHHHHAVEAVKEFYGKYLHPDSITESKDTNGDARAGSELAARYFCQQRPDAGPVSHRAVTDFGRLCGDYDVWRDPMGPGGQLALAVDLMEDYPQAMLEMVDAVEMACSRLAVTLPPNAPINWADYLTGFLGEYLSQARGEFTFAVEQARRTAIAHGPHLMEIYTDFHTSFASLIAMAIYEETKGVVVARYQADRAATKKLSLRRHPSIDVDLQAFARLFGGGGHVMTAGCGLAAGQTMDDLIDLLRPHAEAAAARRDHPQVLAA